MRVACERCRALIAVLTRLARCSWSKIILTPLKSRSREGKRALEWLQMIMASYCLRRTKQDKVPPSDKTPSACCSV